MQLISTKIIIRSLDKSFSFKFHFNSVFLAAIITSISDSQSNTEITLAPRN